MKTELRKLVESLRRKNWHDASEAFNAIMQQKVAARLTEERQRLNLKEGSGLCKTCGKSVSVPDGYYLYKCLGNGKHEVEELSDDMDGPANRRVVECGPACDKKKLTEAQPTGWEGGLDNKCDKCDKIADWRARDPKTNKVIGAACKAHKEEVRSALIAKLTKK